MVFRLKLLWRKWWFGNCFFINFKNIFPILVLTFWLNGGWDDELAAIKSTSGPVLDEMRKKIIGLFKEEGLTITIDTILIKTDFLDMTFNLSTGKLFPFRKPNNVPLYINVKSNHPSTIIKDLPKTINERLSELSCNKDEFYKAELLY